MKKSLCNPTPISINGIIYYLLKKRGANVIYLGTSIPMNDVAYVVNLKKPDYLYCHLTTVGQSFNFDKFLLNIGKKFHDMAIIISGQLTNTYEKKIHPPIHFKRSFPEVMEFVATL